MYPIRAQDGLQLAARSIAEWQRCLWTVLDDALSHTHIKIMNKKKKLGESVALLMLVENFTGLTCNHNGFAIRSPSPSLLD